MRKTWPILLLLLTTLTQARADDPITGSFLNGLQQRVEHVIQQSAECGSLLTAQAARDIELEIYALRQGLNDDLDKQWSKLGSVETKTLGDLAAQIQRLDDAVATGGKIEENAYLDADQLLNKIPFMKGAPSLRRIDNARFYYRETPGAQYDLTLTGNMFSAFFDGDKTSDATIVIGDPKGKNKIVRSSDVEWLGKLDAYRVRLTIPAQFINDFFSDLKLVYVPVTISTPVDNTYYYVDRLWRPARRPATFRFHIELLPRYPAFYRLVEKAEVEIPDHLATPVTQPGKPLLIAGCGHDGCNENYQICTDVPPGAEPVAIIPLNPQADRYGHDSLNYAWGEWIPGTQQRTLTGFCAAFHQHRPQERSVWIDVSFYPLRRTSQVRPVALRALTLGTFSPTQDLEKAKKAGFVPTGNEDGVFRVGIGYAADYDRDWVNYELVVRTFTGEEIYAVLGKSSNPILSVTTDQGSRSSVIELKMPW